MATLNGTSLLPPAFNQPEAGKVGYLLCTYTGAANDSQQLVTSARAAPSARKVMPASVGRSGLRAG